MSYALTLTFLFCSIAVSSFAQETHWNDQLLEVTKGKKVIRWEKPASFDLPWVSVIKFKKKVGLYTVTILSEVDSNNSDSTFVDDVYNLIPPTYDRIESFQSITEEETDKVDDLQGQIVEVAEVSVKKKTGIIVRYGDAYDMLYLGAKHFFQEIDWKENNGTHVPVMIEDKWGIYDWYQQGFLFECEYNSMADLPKTTDPNGFNTFSASIFNAFNKHKEWESIDLIDLDNGNGDGIFLAQSKATEKYGMYQYIDDKTIIEAIPMKYDSMYYFSWNGSFTPVFNEGKVGIYLSYWSYEQDAKQSVPCTYEDYKIFNKEDDDTKVLAVKKDGKWGWIDWLTNEEKSEFKYESTEDLPYPYYKQKYWLEE